MKNGNFLIRSKFFYVKVDTSYHGGGGEIRSPVLACWRARRPRLGAVAPAPFSSLLTSSSNLCQELKPCHKFLAEGERFELSIPLRE